MAIDGSQLTALLADLGIAPGAINDLVQHGAAPGMAAAQSMPNAPAGMDPLQLIQLLASSSSPGATARPAGPAVPPSGPIPNVARAAADTPARPGGHGVNWHALMNLVAPVVGEVATHGQRGSFLEGFMRAQQRAELKKQQEADVLQKRKTVGADYLLKIGEHAQGLSDPTDFENFLNLAEHAGTQAGYLQPGDLRNTIKYNGGKQADAQLKELTDQLAQLEKGGYDTDQLAQSGAQLHLKSGKTIPISTALDLTRQRPLDASGNTVPRPKKQDVSASTDYGRFLSRYAQGKGKTVDQLSAADELDAKKQYGTADNATPTGDYTSRYLDTLVSLWKDQHPNQEPPLAIKQQLMLQAKKDVGQADDKAAGGGGLRDYQQFMISDKLAKEWLDISKPTREMNRQFQLMQTGLERFRAGDKNGGSQAVLVTFQKILDPSSVVRESEYARSSEGISLMGRIQGYADRLKAGGAGVPAQDLAAMVETSKQFLQNMQGYTQGQRRRIEAQTKKWGIDPVTVFDEVPGQTTTNLRADGTPKGDGFFGPLSRPDGTVSSEISIGVNIDGKNVEIPTLVPTLTPQEKQWLLTNDISDPKKLPKAIVDKAVAFARQRIAAGQSPFAGANESPAAQSQKIGRFDVVVGP